MAGAGLASADTGASGASAQAPGLLSGALAQAPAADAANPCGSTLNTVGLLNPVLGTLCATPHQGSADRSGATAAGTAHHSPGAASGDVVQLPLQAPVNACGNTVNALALLNPSAGNDCRSHHPGPPHRPSPPPRTPTPPPTGTPPAPGTHSAPPPPPTAPALQPVGAQLAHTGAGGLPVEVPAALGLLSLGALLYHRARRSLPD
ncbi:chaplin [Streptacidiphilus carbonis]|uniref:chaplin n=1 Tax=Streptacidiphilus carbonis TaxID=105422 RepID=UPI001F16F19E|nr:chaplin [Streptacidiphilus carbonis]